MLPDESKSEHRSLRNESCVGLRLPTPMADPPRSGICRATGWARAEQGKNRSLPSRGGRTGELHQAPSLPSLTASSKRREPELPCGSWEHAGSTQGSSEGHAELREGRSVVHCEEPALLRVEAANTHAKIPCGSCQCKECHLLQVCLYQK